MMNTMEWEPIIPNAITTTTTTTKMMHNNNNNKENNDHRSSHKGRRNHDTSTMLTKTATQPLHISLTSSSSVVTDAERRMIHMLLPHDVLLKGKPSLQQLVHGNQEYNDLIQCYKGPFGIVPREQKYEIIHIIMTTIWSQQGRFLQYDSTKGTISVLSNEQTEHLIRQHLKTQNKKKRQSSLIETKSKQKTNDKKKSKTKDRSKAIQVSKGMKHRPSNRYKNKMNKSKSKQHHHQQQQHNTETITSSTDEDLLLTTPTSSVPTISFGTSPNIKLFGKSQHGIMYGDV